ncbi:MAG: hypothetical protein WA183_13545 [Chthoniobacterales bacterium]
MNEQDKGRLVVLRFHLSNLATVESLMETQRAFLKENISLGQRCLDEWEQRFKSVNAHFEAKELDSPHAPSVTQAGIIIQKMRLFCNASLSMEEERRRKEGIETIRNRPFPPESASWDEVMRFGLSVGTRLQQNLCTWDYGVDLDRKLESSLNSVNEAFDEFERAFDDQNQPLTDRWLEEWKARRANFEQIAEDWMEEHDQRKANRSNYLVASNDC